MDLCWEASISPPSFLSLELEYQFFMNVFDKHLSFTEQYFVTNLVLFSPLCLLHQILY